MAKKPRIAGVIKFDAPKEVRAIARERVGIVKPSQAIIPKSERKPKHKPDYQQEPPN